MKSEDGSVQRTFTQFAQTWPLADNAKFENIEAATHVLRQARDYLYQGLKHVGSAIEQTVHAEKMQNVVNAMGEIAERNTRMQEQLVESLQRTEAISVKLDQMSGRIGDATRGWKRWEAD